MSALIYPPSAPLGEVVPVDVSSANPGVSPRAARGDHSHGHGNLSAKGGSHHDATQVTAVARAGLVEPTVQQQLANSLHQGTGAVPSGMAVSWTAPQRFGAGAPITTRVGASGETMAVALEAAESAATGVLSRSLGLTTASAPGAMIAGYGVYCTLNANAPPTLLYVHTGTGPTTGAAPACATRWEATTKRDFATTHVGYIAGVQRFVWNATGLTLRAGDGSTMTGLWDITTGKLTAPGGVQPGTTADTFAAYSKNTLFTPALSGSTTAGAPATSTLAGVYTALDNLVDGKVDVQLTAIGGAAGDVRVSLPKVAGARGGVGSVSWTNFVFPNLANVTGLFLEILPNATFARLMYLKSTGAAAPVQWADLAANTGLTLGFRLWT